MLLLEVVIATALEPQPEGVGALDGFQKRGLVVGLFLPNRRKRRRSLGVVGQWDGEQPQAQMPLDAVGELVDRVATIDCRGLLQLWP